MKMTFVFIYIDLIFLNFQDYEKYIEYPSAFIVL